MKNASLLPLLLATTSLALAACNAGPLLQTGSLTPKPADAAPKPATALDRALHAAATAARAQKCGYFFDPGALRTNFLTAEAQRGTPQPELAKITEAYDYTHRTISGKIANSEEYCASEERTTGIKSSLNQLLAGNFEPPQAKKKEEAGGLFASFDLEDNRQEVFNPGHIYDPLLNESPTRKVDPD